MVKEQINEVSRKKEFDRTVLEDIEMDIWLRGYKAVYNSCIKSFYQRESEAPTYEEFVKDYVLVYGSNVFKNDLLFIEYYEKELKEDYKKYYGTEV